MREPKFNLRAAAAYARGNAAECERLCRAVLGVKANHFDALYLLADVRVQRGSLVEALASYDRALTVRPDHADALVERGTTLFELNRLDEAVASYDRALAIEPNHVLALYNRGGALRALHRFDEALASYDKALAVRLEYPEALNNRGLTLKALMRYPEALASYDHALAIRPDHVNALNNRGNVLSLLRRHEDALNNFERSLALAPDNAEALYNRGVTLMELGRYAEARSSLDRSLAIDPRQKHTFSALADCRLKLCDWASYDKLLDELRSHVTARKSVISPFVLLGCASDDALQLQCTRTWAQDQMAAPAQALWRGASRRGDRIRIAYLSADFHRHATAWLIAGLIERHDRARFEVIGVSYGADDNSEMRARLAKGFDRFHDVRNASDRAAANLIHDLEVDIAIDLKGYTTDSRPAILAHRPAPIQANFLGYPGTMGAGFVDYIIADPIVLPFERQEFYTVKIVHLPGCYQVNDSTRRIPAATVTRADAGLPERGLVFCCFNQSYKIAPPVFDVWMRLLQSVEGSVLWLLRDNPGADANLRKEAAARGVDPARLVFGGKQPIDAHLARHRLADLFVDTLPYNAHTTGSDALWMGLPLLTCRGQAFAGRVAASLLHAAGLPELVTNTLADYEALALKLAREPDLLAALKTKLAANRGSCPLFDTARFARHIEAATTAMWETWQRGEAPKSFAVEPG